MNTKTIFWGGCLFLMGLLLGVHLGNNYNYETDINPQIPMPAPNGVEPPVPKSHENEIGQFMKKYPNLCLPMGNKELACLPNFLVIGAMKAGTTFIDHYLQLHPQIAKHPEKEIFFFSQQHFNGIQWYSDHFEETTLGDGKVIGESTPIYLPWPLVPERVRLTIPNVKLIITLRDPVERTHSQYHHAKRWILFMHHKPLQYTFEEMLEEELQLINHCKLVDPSLTGSIRFLPKLDMAVKGRFYNTCWTKCEDCFPNGNSLHGGLSPAFGLLTKSLYYEHILNWFRLFHRSQFLIVKYEDIEQDPAKFMHTIHDFLGIEKYDYDTMRPQNSNSYADMDPTTRKALNKFFYTHTKNLYDLLGVDYGWESAINPVG